MMPVREKDETYHDPFAPPKKVLNKKKVSTILATSSSLKKTRSGSKLSKNSSK